MEPKRIYAIGDWRTQEVQECEKPKDSWYPIPCDKYYGFSANNRCSGCNYDGTRWVTIND